MMKHIIYTFLGFCLIGIFLTSCYDDLGNYDYTEINEIEVDSIRSIYSVDVDEELIIKPIIKGTQYQDTSLFSYEWEIGSQIVAETHDLDLLINMVPGTKISRFIVTDKESGIKRYFQFSVQVSSSTAGDLIMVLSKHKGKAELSYLRLDKPSNWAVNYFESRNGESLATDPKQLCMIYSETSKAFPFTTTAGRVMVLADNTIKLVNKQSLSLDTVTPILRADHYTGNASYPKPDTEGYKSEFAAEAIGTWRKSPYGNYYQLQTFFMQISGGTVYSARLSGSPWSASYSYKSKTPYDGGYLTDFGFFDEMAATPNNNLTQLGYTTGDFMVYDNIHSRFAKGGTYGGVSAIEEKYVKKFTGYDLLWGSATNIASKGCIAVLNDGENCKFVLLNTGKTDDGKADTKKVVAELNCGAVVNSTTKFYVMKYTPYMFFVTGDKLYKYNLLDIASGSAPSSNNLVATLSDYDYDANAIIKDICISRSERTLLLAVSRYGADTEGAGDEAKGDLIYFDLDKESLEINHIPEKSYKGISGMPIDLEIKYQTHWRDGFYIDGTMKDNI